VLYLNQQVVLRISEYTMQVNAVPWKLALVILLLSISYIAVLESAC